MTKRRDPLTYHRTLTLIAARIGWDRCAAICGVTERMVRYWSDPDCETEIRLLDAERLDRAFLAAGGDHAPFHHLNALRLDLAAMQAGSVAQLATLAAAGARETGEAVAALVIAASGQADPATLRTARAETEEAIEILTQALGALQDLPASTGMRLQL